MNVEDPIAPRDGGRPAPTWVRTDEWYNFTAEPRGKVHVLATLDESTYEEQDGSAAADDHPIAWCSNYDGGRHFYTALGHHGTYWEEAAYRAHIPARSSGPPARPRATAAPSAQGIPTDAVVRQGRRSTTTPRTRWRSRSRRERQRLLRRARRPRQAVRPGRPQRPRHRHDPRAPRQRERPARHRARPGLRDQPPAVPLLQRADAGGAARLPLHARRGRHDRHGLREAAADDPAPADHLLPLVRLDGVRARRRPVHLHGRRHRARRVAGLQPDRRRRPAQQRAGHQPGRRPRLRRAPHLGQHERPARQDPAHPAEGRPDRRAGPGNTYDIPAGQPLRHRRAIPGVEARRGPRSTRWATATRSGSRSTRRPAGSTTARSGRTRTPRTPTAARAATTSSTRSARPATWAGRTASPTTSRTATGRSRAARRAARSTAPARRRRRTTLGLEHRPRADARRPPARALVAVLALPGGLPVRLRPDRDPDRLRPHGDRRPDVPLRRRADLGQSSSRPTTTTRCSSPTGRATGSRR